MDNKNFWNDVAKWGVLIGIIMGSSRILEYGMMLSGDMTTYALLTFEYVIVGLVYGVLLYYVTRSRAVEVYESMGFSFGRTLNYAMLISIFAAVVVAAMSYVYINSVMGGFNAYMDQLVVSITAVMDDAQMDNSTVEMYLKALEDLQSAERTEPSIFSTLMSSISSYVIAGAGVGTIVALVIKRYIKKNLSNDEQQNNG
ncbi:MAG: DUF4199 domain-containing protein [Rikenellaceae bacterium]